MPVSFLNLFQLRELRLDRLVNLIKIDSRWVIMRSFGLLITVCVGNTTCEGENVIHRVLPSLTDLLSIGVYYISNILPSVW